MERKIQFHSSEWTNTKKTALTSDKVNMGERELATIHLSYLDVKEILKEIKKLKK